MDEKLLQPVVKIIGGFLEEFDWIISHINKSKGRLVVPKGLLYFFTEIKQPPWSSLYQYPKKIQVLPLLFLVGYEELEKLSKRLESLSPSELEAFKFELIPQYKELYDEIDEYVETFKLPTKKEVKAYLENTSFEQKEKDLTVAYYFWTSFITHSYQFMALYTYGKTMCRLVQEASDGNNLAFVQAISIDRTVLFGVPFFQKKLIALQLGSEPALLENVAKAIKREKLNTSFTYPEVNLVFSILQQEGYLNKLKNAQIRSILEELRIYGSHDSDLVSKLKTRFLKRQGHQI